MKETQPLKLSVSLALQALSEAVEDTARAQTALEQSRGLRDDYIRDAYDAGVPMVRLVRITGLSREALYKITRKG